MQQPTSGACSMCYLLVWACWAPMRAVMYFQICSCLQSNTCKSRWLLALPQACWISSTLQAFYVTALHERHLPLLSSLSFQTI